ERDRIVPLVNARVMAARIPRARLVVVRGGGHLFILERADELAPVVEEFLAAPLPAARGERWS
ncbi:MAG: alpha/beta fold hydrolase, partial [Acidimicrobiia bacterium]